MNHQTVRWSVSGRTAATISRPGHHDEAFLARPAFGGVAGQAIEHGALDGSPASASSGGGGAFVVLGAGHAAIDGIAVEHRAIGDR